MSEQFELYSIELCIAMSKSKPSTSSVAVSSIFVVHLEVAAQFLNVTWAAVLHPKMAMLPFTRI